jgi:hypothetical protein
MSTDPDTPTTPTIAITAERAAAELASALELRPSEGAIVDGGDRWVVLTFGNWDRNRIRHWIDRPVEWIEAGPMTIGGGAITP